MKTFTIVLLLSVMTVASQVRAQSYCMLPNRTSYSNDQPGITTFKLNTINRVSGNVENPLSAPPVVVTNDSTTLVRGKTYTVTIVHSKDAVIFPNARNNMRVWIDYNRNFDFSDAGETVISKDNEAPGGTYTGTFTVPANAPLGKTRLRATAKMGPDAGHTAPTPCDTLPKDPLDYHGEMEDYTVIIKAFPDGIEDVNANGLQASVYPNPASDHITVSLGALQNRPLSIAAYDVTGKQVASLLNEPVQSAAMYTFSLNDHIRAAGVYFIKISSGEASSYQKLIKTY